MSTENSVLFVNARLVDPVAGTDSGSEAKSLRVERGKIIEIALSIEPHPGESVVDLGGAVLAPANFDPHVHFREPGQSYKETLETGSRAAVAGGFSDVAVMANTQPTIDEAFRLEGIRRRTESIGLCRVHVVAACTLGLEGERLTEMAALREAGAFAFSDDGLPVVDSLRMRRVLEWARLLGTVVITHAEEPSLKGRGQMNEGSVSGRMGLAGIPAGCESIAVARDIELASLTGARLHVAHVSTARSVEMIREAKSRGVRVTAETAPHYLIFTDEDVEELATHAKMNPPLRTAADRTALRAALADGTIDLIATDHAPHTPDEKMVPFADAPFGVVGLETSLAAAVTALHHEEGLPLATVFERLSAAPRRVFGLEPIGLTAGAPADLVAFDPQAEWTVEPDAFHTKGRHTPFRGSKLRGRILGTWLGGRRVFERPAGEATDGSSAGTIYPIRRQENEALSTAGQTA
jgi:dihydroorotase